MQCTKVSLPSLWPSKKIEEEYSIELFDRSHYRPKLTEAGKNFYKEAKKVIKAFQQLEQSAQSIGQGFESEISICIDSIFPIAAVSSILSKFFDPHISTSLNLNADVLEGVIQKVLNQEVDFALGPKISEKNELEVIKIAETKIVPVIGRQHAEKAQGNLNLLKQLPQIVVSSSIKEQRENVLGAVGETIWYTSDFSMREQLIEAGLGWGRLPIHHIEDKVKNKTLSIIEDIPEVRPAYIPMYLIRNREKVMGPNTQSLWDYLCSLKDIKS